MTLTPKLLGATLAAILMPVASTSRAEVPSPEPPGWAMECKNAIVANAQQGVDHCTLLALMVLGQAPDQILAVINEYDGPTSMKGLLDNANEIAWTSPASAELGLIAATGMAALETLGVEQHEIVAQGLRDEAARMADETFLNLLEENSQFGLVAAGDVYKDACAASQTSNQPDATESTPNGFNPNCTRIPYTNATVHEAAVCAAEPYDCARAWNAASDADVWAKKYYPKGGWNDKQDAMRHCAWSALMTKRANSGYAYRMGTAHEDANENNPPKERAMDEHNNYHGRQVGVSGEKRPDKWIAQTCKDHTEGGYLITRPGQTTGHRY